MTLTRNTPANGTTSLLEEHTASERQNITTPHKFDHLTTSASSIEFPNAQNPSSPSRSETTSFLQREQELQSIEKRFGDVMARQGPLVPITSRFREEFSSPLFKPTRASLLNKLHLSMPARFKTRSRVSSDENRPPASFGSSQPQREKTQTVDSESMIKQSSRLSLRPTPYTQSSPVYLSPSSLRDESATDLWQRAVRLESEERRSSQGAGSTSRMENGGTTSPSPINFDVGSWKGTGVDLSAKHSDEALSQLTSEGDKVQSDERSKRLIQRWIAEMLPQAASEVENIRTGGSLRLKKPPKSWSRFPSHTREKRTKYASAKDQVTPKDFAIREIASDGRVIWATDKELEQREDSEQGLSRSFSIKLGNAVKSKLARILPTSKDKGEAMTRSWKLGAISHESKQLEYPELEILPTDSGFNELQALGKEIDNLTGRGPGVAEKGNAGQAHTRSLASRISAHIHEVARPECEGCDSTLPAIKNPGTPGTPSSPSPTQESVVTETFVTPQSRFSPGPNTPSSGKLSNSESFRSERQVQKLSNDDSLATIRPRSVTWAGQTEFNVSDSTKSEEAREGLNSHLQVNPVSQHGGQA